MSRPSARMSPRPIDEVTIRSELIGDAHDAYEAICGSGMTALPESRYSCNSSEGQARWYGTGFDRCPFPLFSSSSLGGRNEGSSRVARGGGIGRAVGLGLCAGTTARLIYANLLGHIRMQGTTLTAVCRRAGGRGEQLTALNVARCVGDIGNNNGQLQCNGGRPAAPTPPRQGAAPGYLGPGYQPSPGTGYPPPGYGPDYGRSEAQAFREHCER